MGSTSTTASWRRRRTRRRRTLSVALLMTRSRLSSNVYGPSRSRAWVINWSPCRLPGKHRPSRRRSERARERRLNHLIRPVDTGSIRGVRIELLVNSRSSFPGPKSVSRSLEIGRRVSVVYRTAAGSDLDVTNAEPKSPRSGGRRPPASSVSGADPGPDRRRDDRLCRRPRDRRHPVSDSDRSPVVLVSVPVEPVGDVVTRRPPAGPLPEPAGAAGKPNWPTTGIGNDARRGLNGGLADVVVAGVQKFVPPGNWPTGRGGGMIPQRRRDRRTQGFVW